MAVHDDGTYIALLYREMDVYCLLQSMGQYWPEENEECECGPFIIEAMSVDQQVPDVTLRELKLTYQPTVCDNIASLTLAKAGALQGAMLEITKC